ncbi:hypothetical protein CO174_04960 [Candidatus Uhrbacteria bacterium CG_4_9_14_3_um_filter_50_9]|uniref:Baseplate protein J-like domain-containing protein n=1 Tax=Candidatus Uhrbacteria bacterium CG_4_9_14_3_um_filter_50_9 TaxID=1975035 RepID=A0A2M7XBC1_9BACT|nr:MAG: hypothetical protein CO174_04960 [Candidatus Uhrbacteria bacterium CG_4_9_14_3_um_filter_50_9]
MPTPKKKTTTKKRVAVKKSSASIKKVPVNKQVVEAPEYQSSAVPLVMYKRIALTFVVIVAFALISVLYLATMQAVIYVDATQTEHAAEFIVTAVETPTSETQIPAELVSGTLGKTKTFEASGEGAIEQVGVATGTVTLHNNMSTSQPLVETTRLLTPEGVLFRLAEQVTVPASGTVTASVYADEEGSSGDIGPSTFTIPGLSSAKQELIYAESSEAFTGGVVMVSVVTQEELDAAVTELTNELLEDAKVMLRDEAAGEYGGEIFKTNVSERAFSIEPNTQADAFEVTVSVETLAVFYNSGSLEQLALIKLYEGLGQGQEFTHIATDELQVTLEAFNEETGQASLRATLTGRAITSRASDRLDVGRFVGMTGEEVKTLLLGEGVAEAVRVEFFPFWVRTVPQLKDHIYIEIE